MTLEIIIQLGGNMDSNRSLKEGDIVTIYDSSWIYRLDKYERYIGKPKGELTVESTSSNVFKSGMGTHVHNCVLKCNRTGAIYLHSQAMCRKVAKPAAELTVKQVEELLGYPVKIVK